ncbi:hypothetical protein [Wukongibacter sp. M2B1]|uniref:hypothetical protein n=1 Tax=Wukongibacter sp. M2B1 TaxID=3088895 RepID=UPI003D7B1C47
MLDKKILDLLKPLKLKYFFKRFIHITSLSLLLWGCTSLIIMVISRFIPITFIWTKLSISLAIMLVLGIIWTFIKKPSYGDTAALIDSFELKERVSTSLELKGKETIVAKIQKEDTIEILEKEELKSKISLRPSMRILLFIFIFIIATVSISFIPSKSYVIAKEKEKSLDKLEEEKAKIEKIKDNVKKDKQLTLDEKKKLEESLEKMKKNLEKAKNVKDAKKELVKSKKELNSIKEEIEKRKIKETAKKLSQNPFTKELAEKLENRNSHEIAKEIEKMAKKIQGMDKEELKKIIDQLNKLGETLKNNKSLANGLKEVKDTLEQSIKEGNPNIAAINQSLQNLNKAINNQLSNPQISGDISEALNTLDNINNTLSQMSGKPTESNQSAKKSGNNSQQSTYPTGERGWEFSGKSPGGDGNSGGQGSSGNQGGGSGNNGNGSGNGQGSGAGNGSTSGNENGGGRQSGGGSGRNGSSNKEAKDYEKIFAPKNLDAEGERSNIHGEVNKTGQKDIIEVKKFGETMGESIPFSEVLKNYKESEIHRLDEEEIPPNMKEIVKEYFIKLDE